MSTDKERHHIFSFQTFLDLRFIVAVVFVVFGSLLLIYGYNFTTTQMLSKTVTPGSGGGGVNMNIYAGWGMCVFGVGFLLWALLAPPRK